MNLGRLLELYRRALLDQVIPFWLRHAIDPNGGINTCIEDDGSVRSRDRWGWSQWRAAWVFSKLYNQIDARPRWRQVAEGIGEFAAAHGPFTDGHWPLLLDGEGRLKRGYESIYNDGFAIYGLVELWRATGRQHFLDLAMNTFRATEVALRSPEPPPAWPYPIPTGCMAQGISMLFSLTYHELAEATGDSVVRAASLVHHQRVMNSFLRSDRGLMLERLDVDGREIPAPEGTVVLPGHAIESMWFQVHIARVRGDRRTLDRAVEAIRWHLEKGWDEVYGGLLLAIDADGGEVPDWPYHDAKLWWPQVEGLYATLLAYEHCGEPWTLKWHERLHEYCFAHFPVVSHGEWTQKLDRQGRPISETVALPVKDPFHLPRALIYCIEVLERLLMNGRFDEDAGPSSHAHTSPEGSTRNDNGEQ